MPIRDTDPRESFAPLGAPIRREPAPTPAPRPEPIGNGLFRRPDGTLETRIPPPPAAPAMRQGMWDRDNPRSKLSPCVMAKWDRAMADAGFPAPRSPSEFNVSPAIGPDLREWNEARNKAGALMLDKLKEMHANPPRMVADWKWPAPTTVTALHATQAEDWLTITKQVRDLPAVNARASLGYRTGDTEGGAKD